MADGHFIERCNVCRTVTAQCRCMACDKPERWTVCESCFVRPPAVAPLAVEQALIPVRAEVGRLRTALLRYGVHRHHCATSLTPPQGGAVPVCNCGYHDALATDTEGKGQ
jgi:hypothetical protein